MLLHTHLMESFILILHQAKGSRWSFQIGYRYRIIPQGRVRVVSRMVDLEAV